MNEFFEVDKTKISINDSLLKINLILLYHNK